MFLSLMSTLSMFFFQVTQQRAEKESLKDFLTDLGETFGCAGEDSGIGDDDGGDVTVGVVNDGGGVVETFKDFFGGGEIDASG